MLSKCANPACSRQFMHLHEGKIFHLSPTPEVEAAAGLFAPSLYERFWLCGECCNKLTLVWGGTEAKLVQLPQETVKKTPPQIDTKRKRHERRRRASSAPN